MAEFSLVEKQQLFVSLLAELILYVYEKGWAFTLSDGYRPDRKGHMQNSLHYERLAQDYNLFVDGNYIVNGEAPEWQDIGRQWESLHELCRWGGRFGDANHFSLEHKSRK